MTTLEIKLSTIVFGSLAALLAAGWLVHLLQQL